jgi:Ca2+-binding RTX toxin-like protein
LFGGTGNDRLSDGAGSDRLAGGDNNDTFIFANDGEIDYILDFEDGKDKIDLRAEGSTLIFPDITVSQSGSDVRLDYAGESIVIRSATGSISVSDIGLDDFILA